MGKKTFTDYLKEKSFLFSLPRWVTVLVVGVVYAFGRPQTSDMWDIAVLPVLTLVVYFFMWTQIK